MCICTCTGTCPYIHIHICVYIYIHMYTHTHTYIHARSWYWKDLRNASFNSRLLAFLTIGTSSSPLRTKLGDKRPAAPAFIAERRESARPGMQHSTPKVRRLVKTTPNTDLTYYSFEKAICNVCENRPLAFHLCGFLDPISVSNDLLAYELNTN